MAQKEQPQQPLRQPKPMERPEPSYQPDRVISRGNGGRLERVKKNSRN